MPDDDDELTGSGENPPEDDLPETGRHDIVPGDEEDEESEERAEGGGRLPPGRQIPSFEEYRRAREEGTGPVEDLPSPGASPVEVPGGWSPFGGGAQRSAGEEPAAGEPGEESQEADEGAQHEGGGSGEDTLPVRSAPQFRGPVGEEDEEEGGDTLDGGESLEGVELPQGEEGWAGPSPFAAQEGADIDEALARQAGYPTDDEHTAEEIHARRVAAHRRHRRNGRIRLLILLAVVTLVVLFAVDQLGGSGKSPPSHPAAAVPTSPGTGKSYLSVAKDTTVLPANLLIADDGGRKLVVVSPTGQLVGWSYSADLLFQNPISPDYAFFNSSGDQIVLTEESHSQIELLNVQSKKATYTYGHYGTPGSELNYLHDPSAAIEYGDGQIVVADLRNCRILELTPPHHDSGVHRIGHHSKTCVHAPPRSFASPVSAFPLKNGGLVITELTGSWVDLLSASGNLVSSFQIPGFTAAADANEDSHGDLVAVDRTHPGAVDILTMAGKVLWHYAPKLGKRELFRPSMAYVLAGGDVLVSDTYDDRVIVIDPKTDKIVWQYGHLHRASGRRGYLFVPVGLDFVHPYSLLDGFPAVTPPR